MSLTIKCKVLRKMHFCHHHSIYNLQNITHGRKKFAELQLKLTWLMALSASVVTGDIILIFRPVPQCQHITYQTFSVWHEGSQSLISSSQRDYSSKEKITILEKCLSEWRLVIYFRSLQGKTQCFYKGKKNLVAEEFNLQWLFPLYWPRNKKKTQAYFAFSIFLRDFCWPPYAAT